jgi:hypothetical protein
MQNTDTLIALEILFNSEEIKKKYPDKTVKEIIEIIKQERAK